MPSASAANARGKGLLGRHPAPDRQPRRPCPGPRPVLSMDEDGNDLPEPATATPFGAETARVVVPPKKPAPASRQAMSEASPACALMKASAITNTRRCRC